MMGLGSFGGGASSSSSSNLSALAPPFTVDRSNPKPSSNPLLHFTEPPYAVPFNSSLHNWQYPHPSASRTDFFSNRDSGLDSVGTTSLPSANDYRYTCSEPVNPPNAHWPPLDPSAKTATDAFSYLAEPEPFYSPYVSPVANDDTPLVAFSEPSYDLLSTSGIATMGVSSQVDYTQSLSGLEYTPQWGGFWNGLVEGKRIELDGSFFSEMATTDDSLVYKDYLKQGTCTAESLSNCEEDSTISHGKCTDVSGREYVGKLGTGMLNDKSFLPQTCKHIPVGTLRTPVFGTSSVLPESHPQAAYLDTSLNSSNHQRPYSPYEKCFQPLDSGMSDCMSVTRSSPSLVIRPPAVGTNSTVPNTVSSKTMDIGSFAAAKSEDFDSYNSSKGKEPHLPSSSQGKEDCFYASQLRFDNHIFVPPSSMKEEKQSDQLHKDALNFMFKGRPECQVPDINVPGGVSVTVDGAEAVKSSENSSDSLDHHNPAVDSPCWKGAPASDFSAFELFEAVTPQHPVKNSEACNVLNLRETQIFPPPNDFVKATSEKLCQNSMCIKSDSVNNGLSPSPTRASYADCPAKENKSGDAAEADFNCPKLSSSKGAQFANDMDKLKKEYDLPNISNSDSNSKRSRTKQVSLKEGDLTSKRKLKFQASVMDAEMNETDHLGGCCVPLHAVEDVSCLHSSGEETDKSVKPHARESAPKLNVQMLVNTVYNLSELLLFHCSNDKFVLKEQDHEALKHIISNLDVCLSRKIVHITSTHESTFPQQETSHKPGEFPDHQMGASAVWPQVTNEAAANSHSQLDCQPLHKENSNYNISVKDVEKFPDFVSLRDNADNAKDNNMVQALKKVLDENFLAEEEMQSQTLLYKNLWLEAEAKLCSISYRARHDRMKIETEKCKSDKAKDVPENNVAVEKLLASKVSPDPNNNQISTLEAKDSSIPKTTIQVSPISSKTCHFDDVEASIMTLMPKTTVQDSPISSSTSCHDDVEASIMARFHILKSQGDNLQEQQLPEEVDTGLAGKRNHSPLIREQLVDTSLDVAAGPHLQHHTGQGIEDKFRSPIDAFVHETVKEFGVCVTDDPMIQSSKSTRLWSQLPSVWYDNSSSDWEHVLKDEVAGQN